MVGIWLRVYSSDQQTFGPWHIKLESKILRQFEKKILTVWGSLDFRIFWKFIGDGLLSNY
jgi:hypothetical protein